MRYRIEFEPSAGRQWRKLPKEVQRRLAPHIDALAEDPFPAGVKKLTGVDDGYRLRVGEHRVLYRVRGDVLLVVVVRVGHRRAVCRRL
jgi:mRNA interferase RelE/StbE